MIKRHSGHVVAVSSIQGKLALPFRSSCKYEQWLCFSIRGQRLQYNQSVTGQNGTDKIVAIFIDSNSTELNFYSVTTSHK